MFIVVLGPKNPSYFGPFALRIDAVTYAAEKFGRAVTDDGRIVWTVEPIGSPGPGFARID